MTSSISGFPRMSRYRDFPVLNDMNIQTHFQLEKHIVFQNIYQDIVAKIRAQNVSAKCGNHLIM